MSRELKKYLKELSKEQLEKELNMLYSRFKVVKDYYASELGTDKGALLKSSKAKLRRYIIKNGSYIKPDLVPANKLIRDFATVSVHAIDVIDLMLYKVELLVEFMEEWGIDIPNVANSVASTYPDVLDLIYEHKLEKTFAKRCEEVECVAGNYGLISNTLNVDEEE